MDLDFIPAGKEEYDFAIPQRFLELPQIRAFLEVLTSDDFRKKLDELGGYSTENAGKIIMIERQREGARQLFRDMKNPASHDGIAVIWCGVVFSVCQVKILLFISA